MTEWRKDCPSSNQVALVFAGGGYPISRFRLGVFDNYTTDKGARVERWFLGFGQYLDTLYPDGPWWMPVPEPPEMD